MTKFGALLFAPEVVVIGVPVFAILALKNEKRSYSIRPEQEVFSLLKNVFTIQQLLLFIIFYIFKFTSVINFKFTKSFILYCISHLVMQIRIFHTAKFL